MTQKKRKLMARVDVQVAVMTSSLSFITAFLVFFLCYQVTYSSTIQNLEQRVLALHQVVEENLDPETFRTINSKEDINTSQYLENHEVLETLKDAAGVLYLYTAKENGDGDFVYIIDGLDMEEDFRYPGDLIEHEIQDEMRRALGGEQIIPNEIVHTDWGDIFISYLPVHDKSEEIVGVIGIEFEAGTTYRTYQLLKFMAPVIFFLFSAVGAWVAYRNFRRLTNPLYKDMATTDSPTNLKNRNAFEVDMHNARALDSLEQVGLVVGDLNKLKYVNDYFGHNRGDDYIRLAADVLRELRRPNMVTYRVGGDEFVVIVRNTNLEELEEFSNLLTSTLNSKQAFREFTPSISCGYALFHQKEDRNLNDTYQRADANMYQQKHKFHEQDGDLPGQISLEGSEQDLES